jgi:hypothetical protein
MENILKTGSCMGYFPEGFSFCLSAASEGGGVLSGDRFDLGLNPNYTLPGREVLIPPVETLMKPGKIISMLSFDFNYELGVQNTRY